MTDAVGLDVTGWRDAGALVPALSDEIEATYVAVRDAGTRAVLARGGSLGQHHGVGLNPTRVVAEALGLPTPFGTVIWPR